MLNIIINDSLEIIEFMSLELGLKLGNFPIGSLLYSSDLMQNWN